MIIEPTLRGDTCADEMRKVYEANKPLRWWQRRKKVSESGNADNLMLRLQNVVHRHYPLHKETFMTDAQGFVEQDATPTQNVTWDDKSAAVAFAHEIGLTAEEFPVAAGVMAEAFARHRIATRSAFLATDELEGLLQECLVKLVDVQGCLAPKDFARNLISRINRIFAEKDT